MTFNTIEELLKILNPDRDLRGDSENWANWMSELWLTTCVYCGLRHGKIVDISILQNKPEIQDHQRCKCIYVPMRTKLVGTATDKGYSGADAYIFYFGYLPDYYIDKATAQRAGWHNWMGNLHEVIPGKMIGGDIYKNKEKKLPDAPGRVWHEADINYDKGYRNKERLIYSNDGLLFVSYDHCQTFYEIIE